MAINDNYWREPQFGVGCHLKIISYVFGLSAVKKPDPQMFLVQPGRFLNRELEATGGFEQPNRGFADPRLRPLGYVASCGHSAGGGAAAGPLPCYAGRLHTTPGAWLPASDLEAGPVSGTTPPPDAS